MKKLFVLFFILIFGNICFADVFKPVNIIDGTRALQTKDKNSNQPLWQGNISTQKITYNGKPFLYIQEDGSGVCGKDKTYKTWNSKAYYDISGSKFAPYQTQLIYKDKNGSVIQTINKNYYPNDSEAVVSVNGKNSRFDMGADLIDKEILGTALMSYPFESSNDITFHLLTNEPQVYKMTMKNRGVENLSVRGRLIQCYKLEMIIDLGALNIFGGFVPKTYFWYSTADPHQFVRYEGLDGGLGTPYVAMESIPFP